MQMDAQSRLCKSLLHTHLTRSSSPSSSSFSSHPPVTSLTTHQFAQELLSTFSTSLGEVALQPSTGGTFTVTITTPSSDPSASLTTTTLWDRKTDGGFPETKELKRRVRDVIDPGRDLGHVDRNHARPAADVSAPAHPGLQRHPAGPGGDLQPSAAPLPASETPLAQQQQQQASTDSAAAARVAQAKANKGQQDVSGADGASLKAQFGKSDKPDAPVGGQECEDCA